MKEKERKANAQRNRVDVERERKRREKWLAARGENNVNTSRPPCCCVRFPRSTSVCVQLRIEDEKNGERFRETFGRVVLRGPLDFNSLTKLPKTRGFLSFPTWSDSRSCYDIYSTRPGLAGSRLGRLAKTELDRRQLRFGTKRNWILLWNWRVFMFSDDFPFILRFLGSGMREHSLLKVYSNSRRE